MCGCNACSVVTVELFHLKDCEPLRDRGALLVHRSLPLLFALPLGAWLAMG